MEEVKRFVGIDVAKLALDLFIGSTGVGFSVANDEVGIQQLLRQLTPADFVILEATGGLETAVASALAAAGIAVAIVNPRQVREILPVPPADWPRLTAWMPKCWRGSVKRCDQRHGR
jgi:transposase